MSHPDSIHRGFYIDNDQFEEAILRGDSEAIYGSLDRLARALVVFTKVRHVRGLDPGDVVQDAIVDAIGRMDRWEQARGTAFSFFTTSIFWTIRTAKRRQLRLLRQMRPLSWDEAAREEAAR